MSHIAPPEKEVLKTLLGLQKYKLWQLVCDFAHQSYAPALKWYTGGKAGVYELKFQKGARVFFQCLPKKTACV